MVFACLAAWWWWHRGHAPKRVAVSVDCRSSCAKAEALALDVWSEERGPDLPLDIVVSEDDLDKLGAPYQLLVPDIDAAAAAEHARVQDAGGDFFSDYRDYRAITAHLEQLAGTGRAELVPIGSSLEARTIWAIKIGNGGTKMLVNGTQHAREWISSMATTCVADRLVRDYDRDPKIRAFVDTTTLWLVPVVNPDGYQYSWASDRYWRKNRRGNHGVDLNRNFGTAWGGDGSSSRKSSEIYHGTGPFSEPETAALRDLAKRERIALHIDFHAYGQLILFPWSYTATHAPDRARYAAVGDRMASAMFAQHETRYRLIQSVELYPASGVSSDWMYADVHAMSYGIELRPKGGRGFVLPPDQIRPTCDEALAAVLELRSASNVSSPIDK